MAIAGLDALLAGLLPPTDFYKNNGTAEAIGTSQSAFYIAGAPGPAAAPSPGAAGAALTAYPGQVPFPAAVGGKSVYLARLEGVAVAGIGMVTLYDRLWHNSGLSVTTLTAQNVNSVAWPARDLNGSSDGVGVNIALEQTSLGGAGTPTFTVSYTNSDGVAGRTGTIGPVATTLATGTFYPMSMQAGDVGVRSVQTIQASATMTTGSYSLVAFRHLASLPTPINSVGNDRDAVALGFPKMHDNSVPFFVYSITATAFGVFDGSVVWAQG